MRVAREASKAIKTSRIPVAITCKSSFFNNKKKKYKRKKNKRTNHPSLRILNEMHQLCPAGLALSGGWSVYGKTENGNTKDYITTPQ